MKIKAGGVARQPVWPQWKPPGKQENTSKVCFWCAYKQLEHNFEDWGENPTPQNGTLLVSNLARTQNKL